MTSPRTVIPAVSVALRRGEELLLVRRGREPAKGLYAFPGGRVEPGESLEQAARRELFEETGLVPGPLSVEGEIDLPGIDGAVYRLTVFRADHAGGDPVAGDDAEAAGWFGLEAMQGLRITASTLAMAGAILGADETAKNSEE